MGSDIPSAAAIAAQARNAAIVGLNEHSMGVSMSCSPYVVYQTYPTCLTYPPYLPSVGLGSLRSALADWYANVAMTTAACLMSFTSRRSTVSMLVWCVRIS